MTDLSGFGILDWIATERRAPDFWVLFANGWVERYPVAGASRNDRT